MADVTVLIATHNRPVHVRQALDSVLAQSVPAREIIVVDDGSTDDTPEQLASYGPPVRVLRQQNAGASAARNFGIRNATSTWVAFLDDDDVWLPAKIEKQMALIERDPALGLVYCSDHAVDDQLRILYTRTAAPQNRGDVFQRLLARNFLFTSCVVARRDLIARAGYMNPAYRFAEDWDLWLRIAATHTVDFVADPLVLYRQWGSGLTQGNPLLSRLRDVETILSSAAKLRPVPRSVIGRARHNLELEWSSAYLSQEDHFQAIRHAFRAVILKPQSMGAYQAILRSLVPKRARDWAKKVLSHA